MSDLCASLDHCVLDDDDDDDDSMLLLQYYGLSCLYICMYVCMYVCMYEGHFKYCKRFPVQHNVRSQL